MLPKNERCRPHHRSCSRHHVELVEGYWSERERQETQMEEATGLWPAEVEAYLLEHQLITFKTWLIGSRRR